jgi:4-hydroxybenzoate polyprenyltransferase
MKAFFNLIRWPNLLIVILTMVLMRYAVLEPLLGNINITLYSIAGNATSMSLQSSWFDFFLLVTATVLITAGGYVINDYFDIQTDLINRGKVIVGTRIPRRKAMMWHNILNICGVAGGFFVAAKTGFIWLGFLFLIVSGLLYFYSSTYKRQFLIGNIIVAILTAMVPMLVVIFEGPVLYQYYAVNAVKMPDLSNIYYWIGGFALFAFLTTLSREIIKDIEDFEGDAAYGRNTVPVIMGVPASKIVAVCLVFVTLLMIYAVWYFYIQDYITLFYISVTLAPLLFFVIYQIIVSKTRKQFHSASGLMKLVMLSGILYPVVLRLIFYYHII